MPVVMQFINDMPTFELFVQEPLAEDLVKPLQNGAEISRPRQNGSGRGTRYDVFRTIQGLF